MIHTLSTFAKKVGKENKLTGKEDKVAILVRVA
jgi:hypothetical protein